MTKTGKITPEKNSKAFFCSNWPQKSPVTKMHFVWAKNAKNAKNRKINAKNAKNWKINAKNLQSFVLPQTPQKVIWGSPMTKICICLGTKYLPHAATNTVAYKCISLVYNTFFPSGRWLWKIVKSSSKELITEEGVGEWSFKVTDLQSKHLYVHLSCRNKHSHKLLTMCRRPTCISLQSPRGGSLPPPWVIHLNICSSLGERKWMKYWHKFLSNFSWSRIICMPITRCQFSA